MCITGRMLPLPMLTMPMLSIFSHVLRILNHVGVFQVIFEFVEQSWIREHVFY